MAPIETQSMSREDAALQARLRLIGNVVLVTCLAGSALAFAIVQPEDEATLEESKRYLYEMEYIGGKSNLLAAEIRQWLAGLLHGRGLGPVLVFVAVAGWATCFFLADRLGQRAAVRRRSDRAV